MNLHFRAHQQTYKDQFKTEKTSKKFNQSEDQ